MDTEDTILSPPDRVITKSFHIQCTSHPKFLNKSEISIFLFSSEDERFLEAAVSFQDIKKKDELLSTFATSAAPILIIQSSKNEPKVKCDVEAEPSTNGSPVKKKKKKKKKNCKEKKENLLEEETEDKKKELIRQNKNNELCSRNDSLENSQMIHVKKKKKKTKQN